MGIQWINKNSWSQLCTCDLACKNNTSSQNCGGNRESLGKGSGTHCLIERASHVERRKERKPHKSLPGGQHISEDELLGKSVAGVFHPSDKQNRFFCRAISSFQRDQCTLYTKTPQGNKRASCVFSKQASLPVNGPFVGAFLNQWIVGKRK